MTGPLTRSLRDRVFSRHWVDLTTSTVTREQVACQDLEDLLGGIGRGFKVLEAFPQRDAYAPEAPLVMNLGVMSGTSLMTGLRTYFHAFSPLKRSSAGLPSAMWSAGSGKFGTKLRFLGIDEVIFTGRCAKPTRLRITRPDAGDAAGEDPRVDFHFEDATELVDLNTNEKIQTLYDRHPEAHFAVIGPAGENYAAVRYAAIALSTENQLKSGDAKARFCGRGGMGGVMGSKNLLAIVADTPDLPLQPPIAALKHINREVGSGDGSRRFREPRAGGLGGTWANAEALNPSHAMPEYNFSPSGTDVSVPLYRTNLDESKEYSIRGEACFRCGIRCHKNIYEMLPHAPEPVFRAKFDYEPLNLLSSNIGIFGVDQVSELIELTDAIGVDAISCAVTLAFAMEFNEGRDEAADRIAGGITFGDFEGSVAAVKALGAGELALLGQGVLRLSEVLGEPGHAMHTKGLEFPAYLPQTNPGYPWALAGGHMSMRTYLLLLNERETSLDYWVDAITSPTRGLSILRDDLVGACKFSGLGDDAMAEAISATTEIPIEAQDIREALFRTFLRGYRLERTQGFEAQDYRLPERAHEEHPEIQLPHFNSHEFFDELRDRVNGVFDEALESQALPIVSLRTPQ